MVKNLVKNLVNNLFKNHVKNLVKNLAKNLVKNLGGGRVLTGGAGYCIVLCSTISYYVVLRSTE